MSRAAGYVRVSSDEQAREGWSIDAQRTRIEERAATEGWDLVRLYEDAGWSGLRSDRPAYRELLDAAAAGELDVVLVWRSDRLGRDTVERLLERGQRPSTVWRLSEHEQTELLTTSEPQLRT